MKFLLFYFPSINITVLYISKYVLAWILSNAISPPVELYMSDHKKYVSVSKPSKCEKQPYIINRRDITKLCYFLSFIDWSLFTDSDS